MHAAAQCAIRRAAVTPGVRPEGWDDGGEEPNSRETIETAQEVLRWHARAAAGEQKPLDPSVLPFADGSIFFKWISGDREIQITVAGREVAVQRWEPLEALRSVNRSEGMAPDAVREEARWLLQ